MEFYKLGFKALILTLTLQLTLVSCGHREPMLKLPLERQAIEKPFTFAEYCEERLCSVESRWQWLQVNLPSAQYPPLPSQYPYRHQ